MCVYIFTNISSTIIIYIFSLSLEDETTHQLLRPSLLTQAPINFIVTSIRNLKKKKIYNNFNNFLNTTTLNNIRAF